MATYNLGTARGKVEIDTSDLTRAGAAFTSFGKQMLGIGALAAAGFGVAVKAAADFEKTISGVAAVLGATDKQMDAAREAALKLGTTTKFSAQEIALGMEDLAKAGLTMDQIIGGAIQGATSLAAAAGDMKLDVAAEIAVNAMKTFGLQAGDLTHVADVLAGAANASTLDVDDLAVSLKYAGSVAKTVGLTIDDTATALAILGDRGIRGSTAGTSLRGVLLSLNPTSVKAAKAMKELGLITEDGSNKFFNAKGEMKSFGEVMQILGDHTKDLSEQQRNTAFNIIFQRRAMASALILAEAGAKGFDDYATAIERVSATEVAEKKLDNLSGDITKLKANIQSMLITAGTPFQDQLREWTQLLTRLVQGFGQLTPETQKTLMKTLAYTAAVFTAVGATNIIVGQTIKFVTQMIQLGRALQFVITKMGVIALLEKLKFALFAIRYALVTQVIPAVWSFTAALLANPIGLIVAALVALGVGLVVLYHKWEPFRKFVDEAWQSFQVGWDMILDFARDLRSKLGSAIDWIGQRISTMVSWVKKNWDLLLIVFTGPIGLIITVVRRFGDDIVNFFQALPGRVIGFISDMLGWIVHQFSQMPERVGGALAFMVGRSIQLIAEWQVQMFNLITSIIEGVVGFFQKLPGRVISFVDKLWDGAWDRTFEFKTKAIDLIGNLVESIANFWRELPGRVIGWVNALWDNLWASFFVGKDIAIQIISDMVGSIVHWFSTLPERVGPWVIQLLHRLFEWFNNIRHDITTAIGNALDDVISFFMGLPGRIWDALGNLQERLFNKMKSIGTSMWEGFKDGLFGSPKTKIEYALIDLLDAARRINTDMGTEMAKLHNMTFNKLGANPVATANLMATGTGGPVAAPTAASSTTTYEGDKISIDGRPEKSAVQVAQEIMWKKRIRIRSPR